MNFDDIFNDNNKVSVESNGTLFKFKDYTPGCRFAGTYVGNHMWESDNGPVIAYDFANVTIDGEKQEETEIFTINQFAALSKLMSNVAPGQILGLRYDGRAERKGNPHVVTPFIDPNNRDENWRRFAGVSLSSMVGAPVRAMKDEDGAELSPALSSAKAAEPEKEVDVAEAFGSPFLTVPELKTKIQMLVADHYKISEEPEVKVKIIEDSELPFNDDLANLEEVYKRLAAKYKK